MPKPYLNLNYNIKLYKTKIIYFLFNKLNIILNIKIII